MRAARAQQPDRVRRIGVLMQIVADDPEAQARLTTFRAHVEHARRGWIRRASHLLYQGAVTGASAKGSEGNVIPSTLSIDPHRLLANVIRRTRKLGRLSAGL